ncbi:hypothetical protein HK096_007793, partial [Nowakowskiella sp. JEL0078]
MDIAPPIVPPITIGRADRVPQRPPPEIPQKTLYLRNLHERKNLKTITKDLSTIFSRFGEIREIKVFKGMRLKGQGFVIFESQESADKAKAEMHGFPLHGKKMDIQYSRIASDISIGEESEDFQKHLEMRKEDKSDKPYL